MLLLPIPDDDSEAGAMLGGACGSAFKPFEIGIDAELLARLQGDLVGISAVLAEKPMGAARKPVAPDACIYDQNLSTGPGDLQSCSHSGVAPANDDDVIQCERPSRSGG